LQLATARLEEHGISYADWKAASLNQIFAEHGLIGCPGTIKADVIHDGPVNLATEVQGPHQESDHQHDPDANVVKIAAILATGYRRLVKDETATPCIVSKGPLANSPAQSVHGGGS
jgi:hypothetical protein